MEVNCKIIFIKIDFQNKKIVIKIEIKFNH